MLAHFVHHLLAALVIPLLPYIRDEFALNYTQAGLLITAFNLAYGISQIPAGWLADRTNPRIMISLGVAGVAILGILVSLSPTYIMLAVFLVLLGAAGGGYHPAATPLIAASVQPQHRGRALGIHQIGGTGSFFVTPLIAAGIAGVSGWRGSFTAIAIPSLIFGAIFHLILGRLQYKRKAGTETHVGQPDLPPAPGHLRHLLALITLSVSSVALLFSIVSFIPLYLVDHFSTTEETAAVMLALAYAGGLGGGLLGGYLSDRLGRVPIILVVGLVGGPLIYLLNVTPFGLGLFAVFIVMGTIQHMGMPVAEAYIITHVSERRRSTMLGVYYFVSRGGPGIIAPVLGHLFDSFGFFTGFSIAAAAMVAITLVCGIFLWGSRN